VAVGSWRNTPYAVIQNVGAYLDNPRFLDAEHRTENAADAEVYLARLQSYAKQLDGFFLTGSTGTGLAPRNPRCRSLPVLCGIPRTRY
jgi:uncharacterized protein (DUF885 family)